MTWEFEWEPGLNTWRRSSLRCSDTTKSCTGEQHLSTPVQLWKPWHTAAVQRLSSRNISVLFAHTGLGIKGISFFFLPPSHTQQRSNGGGAPAFTSTTSWWKSRQMLFLSCRRRFIALPSLARSEPNEMRALKTLLVPLFLAPSSASPSSIIHLPSPWISCWWIVRESHWPS